MGTSVAWKVEGRAGRFARAAVRIAVEIEFAPLLEMNPRQHRRRVGWNILDKPIPLVLRGYDAPGREGRWILVAPLFATADRGKQHQTIDQRGMFCRNNVGWHRAPGMRDQRQFVDILMPENEADRSFDLLGRILGRA